MKFIFSLSLTLIFPFLLPAQDLLSDTSATVVITAHRQSTSIFESPEAISSVNAKELSTRVSRSMAEALIGMTGVWMQKTNHGGGSPFVRGLTGNQTLLLVDGIRLNNSTYRYGPNQYFNTLDVLNIQQVEVLRGAGAVLYGSDALGGTIQVLTRDGRFSDSGTEVHGSLLGRILSSDMEQGGRAELELSSEKISVLGGFSYRDFGDLLAGGELGVQAPSAYQEAAGDVKLKAKLGQNSVLTLAYNGVFQSDVGRYDQVAQRGYQTYLFDPQNRQLGYARLQISPRSSVFNQIKITTAWQNSLEGRVKQREESNIRTYEEDKVNTLSITAEAQTIFRKNWTSVSGVEVYHDQVNSFKEDENTSTGNISRLRGLYPDDSKALNMALFTSHTFDFKPFKINAGGRFNFFDIQIQDETFGNTSLQPTALVGNLSLWYQFHPRQALIASVNTGFRAPNINDLSSFGSFDFGIEVPSSDLSPEKNTTYEIGYKVNTPSFRANAAFYYMQLFDLITRQPGTFQGSPTYQGEDVYQKINTAQANIKGFEVDAFAQLTSKLAVLGNLTYTIGQDEDKDEPLRRMPPLNGRFAIQYQHPGGFFSALEWWYASEQDRLSGGDLSDHRIADGGTPGWSVLNVNVGYKFGQIQLNGGLQNILDEAYRIHGSGVDGAGRHVWLALQYSF